MHTRTYCTVLTVSLLSFNSIYVMETEKKSSTNTSDYISTILRPRCAQTNKYYFPFVKKVHLLSEKPFFIAGIIKGRNEKQVKDFTEHLKLCASEQSPENYRGKELLHYIIDQAKKNFVTQVNTKQEKISRTRRLLSLSWNIIGLQPHKKARIGWFADDYATFGRSHNLYIFPPELHQDLKAIKKVLPEVVKDCDKFGEMAVVNEIFDNQGKYPSMILVLGIEELSEYFSELTTYK